MNYRTYYYILHIKKSWNKVNVGDGTCQLNFRFLESKNIGVLCALRFFLYSRSTDPFESLTRPCVFSPVNSREPLTENLIKRTRVDSELKRYKTIDSRKGHEEAFERRPKNFVELLRGILHRYR